jgi:hypothetical protein
MSVRIAALPMDLLKFMFKILSRNRRFLKRDLKGNFFIEEADLASFITGEITYDEIRDERRLHSERLLAHLYAQQEEPQQQEENEQQKETQPQKEKQPLFALYDKEKKEKLPIKTLCNVYHQNRTNKISYNIDPSLLAPINDFTSGYRNINLNVLTGIRSRYSRILFVYFSGTSDTFSFEEETLRDLFQCEDKYHKISSIKKRLENVSRNFNAISVGFTFESRRGKKGKKLFRMQVQGIDQYKPVRNKKEEEERETGGGALSQKTILFLKEIGMNDKGIAANKKDLKLYADLFSEEKLIAFLKEKMNSQPYKKGLLNNPIGWMLNAVRKEAQKEQDRQTEKWQDHEIQNPLIKQMSEKISQKFNSS